MGVPLTRGFWCSKALENLNGGMYNPSAKLNNFMISWTKTDSSILAAGKTPQEAIDAFVKKFDDAGGNMGALRHALTTNDEGGLGMTVGLSMAANVAGGISFYHAGNRTIDTGYCLSILQGAGINKPTIQGQSEQGGNATGPDGWGAEKIGGDSGDLNSPFSPGTAAVTGAVPGLDALNQIGQFFQNLSSPAFWQRMLKGGIGLLFLIIGISLFIKAITPPQVASAAGKIAKFASGGLA